MTTRVKRAKLQLEAGRSGAEKARPGDEMPNPPTAKKVIADFPPRLFARTEAATRELGISRSALMRKAMEEFLSRRERAKLVRKIDDYFASHGDEERELANEFVHADADIG